MQKNEHSDKEITAPGQPEETPREDVPETPGVATEKDYDELVHANTKKEEPDTAEEIDPDEAVHRDHTPPPQQDGERDIDDLMH
jgi:hypothetical protein